MWSKTLFLALRVRVRSAGHRIRLFFPLAVYPLSGFLLGCDAAISLLPGSLGDRVRKISDTLHGVVYEIMDSEPQTFVHVDVEDGTDKVFVDVSTCGFSAGEEI